MKKLLILSLLICSGCQDSNMKPYFKDNEPKILTDKDGNKFIVEYHKGNGNMYIIKPLSSK